MSESEIFNIVGQFVFSSFELESDLSFFKLIETFLYSSGYGISTNGSQTSNETCEEYHCSLDRDVTIEKHCGEYEGCDGRGG